MENIGRNSIFRHGYYDGYKIYNKKTGLLTDLIKHQVFRTMMDGYLIGTYESMLNLVRKLETDETTYSVDIPDGSGNCLTLNAQFGITPDGDYNLSFSDNVLPQNVMTTCRFMIHSDLHDIIVDKINVREKDLTLPNDCGRVFSYLLKTREFRCVEEFELEDHCLCAFYKYDSREFNSEKSRIINHAPHSPQRRYLNLSIRGCEFEIIWGGKKDVCADQNERFMAFFSKSKINMVTFKKIVDSMRLAWGLTSGYYIGKSVYYASFEPKGSIKMLHYYNLQEEVMTYRGLLDYPNYFEIDEEDLCLTVEEFERLVGLLCENESFYRASQLLLQAIHDNGLSKGGLAAIALETIAGEIEKSKKKQEPDKGNCYKLPEALAKELQECINRFEDEGKITQKQAEHYLKKLNGL